MMWLIEKLLTRMIRHGEVKLVHPDGTTRLFGHREPGFSSLTLKIHDRSVPVRLAMSPSLGFAEAYMDGRLTIEGGDIMDFVGLAYANAEWERGRQLEPEGMIGRMLRSVSGPLRQINHRRAARANVAHHYDLSSQLYDLFLDRERQYSCAYWTDDTPDLEAAQQAKLAHIAAKLALKPGMKVLDIGCGWGGMALYLHRHYGVDVTGITLSKEQLAIAQARAAREGVADHVRFELIDYRDKRGQFDRIVSVGMFEHVGTPNYRTFFRCCHNLLGEDGVMLLHTIGRMDGPGAIDPFTHKYIFPGGYIPALSEIVSASEPNKLIVTDVESLRLHYALTLRAWYARCMEKREQIEALYDARFFRMWAFYLAGATAAFEHGGILNYQVQFARNRRTLPITRDYMRDAELALTGRD